MTHLLARPIKFIVAAAAAGVMLAASAAEPIKIGISITQ